MKIVIIGGGIAGLAACFTAVREGMHPLLLSRGMGATDLSTGAADLRYSGSGAVVESLPSQERDWLEGFFADLRLYEWGHRMLASSEGVVRGTDAAMPHLLSLDQQRGSRIGVVDLPRADFRARDLAACFTADPWSRANQIDFIPIELPSVFSEAECKEPLASFCGLLDEPERQSKLLFALEMLKQRQPELGAMLLGPWLGEKSGGEFAKTGALPFGETLSGPDGPFCARFQSARLRWLTRKKIELLPHRVNGVSADDSGVLVQAEGPDGKQYFHRAAGVVAASGGLVGGGVLLASGEDATPSLMKNSLIPTYLNPSGSLWGWDAQVDQGKWVLPPHVRGQHVVSPAVEMAGDARTGTSFPWGAGTIVSAALSGRKAVERLLRRR